MGTIEERLALWLSAQNLGKKAGTQDFNSEIVETIRKNLPNLARPAGSVTELDILTFAERVNHYCPSRWNAMVSALRAVTHQGNALKRRKARFREFQPPTQAQFLTLLAECDKLPVSQAGSVVRFLSLTGLRINEAKQMRWQWIGEDRSNVPSSIAKNGKSRSIPFLPGLREVLDKLRTSAPESDLILPVPNVRRGLEKACLRAGVEFLSYHCFRHIFATRCIEHGVDLPTVARWLGHSDGGALLARMYFHLLDSHSREMAELVKML